MHEAFSDDELEYYASMVDLDCGACADSRQQPNVADEHRMGMFQTLNDLTNAYTLRANTDISPFTRFLVGECVACRARGRDATIAGRYSCGIRRRTHEKIAR